MKKDVSMFPIPTKEKVLRIASWLVVGAIAVTGINFALPSVTLAFQNMFELGVSMSKLAILAGVVGVGGLMIAGLYPAIRTFINTVSYKALAFVINRYPIVQMDLFYETTLRGIDEDKEAKAKLEEIAETTTQQVDEIQERVDVLTAAVKDTRVSASTREASSLELAMKLEEVKPYQGILNMLRPVIATAEESIRLQERAADGIKGEIRVQTAKFNASEQMEVIAGIFGKNFAKSTQDRRNFETARDVVFAKYGAASGRIKDMRGQMEVMIRAALVQDEISAAAARKHVEDSMRVIDIPAQDVEVLSDPTAGANRRLIDKSNSFLNV